MALIKEFGYLVYGVTDLEESTEFFRTILQLEVSERRDGVVFLTGDTRHAWVRLEQRPENGLIRVGFRVTAASALTEISRRLADEGIAVTPGGTLREDRIDNSIRFTTPQNFEVELYEEQMLLATSPAPKRGLVAPLHTVISVPDVVEARDFFKRTMDFKRSDQIEELVVFLRCGNGYHHSIGLSKGVPGQLDHLCLLVDDIDNVVRFRNHARAHNIKAEDLVRHTASGSISVYVQDPNLGIGIELCTGHDVITDEDYNGRLLKAGPVTADRWSQGFPDVTPPGFFGQGGGTGAGAAVSGA
jgi:2,3-dihydroxy-p-cumate/2,3-dihydroxybenzoate 3,4-dioxygenase